MESKEIDMGGNKHEVEFTQLSGYTNGSHYYQLSTKYENYTFESEDEVGDFIIELSNLLHDDELDPSDKIHIAKWWTTGVIMNYITFGSQNT